MAKRSKSKRPRSAYGKRKAVSKALGDHGTLELASELRRRGAAAGKLHRRRDRLIKQIAELDAEIVGLGGAVFEGKRPRNESNLADALAKLLKGNPLNVTDAAEKVQEAGYRTTSPNFRTIVNQALINDKRFKRVSRGVYRA